MLATYFINLDRDADRRAAIEAELRKIGIEAQRHPAVDGANLPADIAAYFAHGDGKPPLITAGEIGCYASHIGIWRQIVANDIRAALVLEDDAVLPPDLRDLISDILERAPLGWDLILLCGKEDRAVKPRARLGNGRTLVRYSRIPPTTAGYLVSLSGAKKLSNPDILRIWPVDWDTRMPWVFRMDTYGVVPPPIRQNTATLSSSITKSSGRSRLRSGIPRPTAYAWTSNPIRTPAAFLYNLRTLGPLWWFRCFALNCGIKIGHTLRPLRSWQRAP